MIPVLLVIALPLLVEDTFAASFAAQDAAGKPVILSEQALGPGFLHPADGSAVAERLLPDRDMRRKVAPSGSAHPLSPRRNQWANGWRARGDKEFAALKTDRAWTNSEAPQEEILYLAQFATSGDAQFRETGNVEMHSVMPEPSPAMTHPPEAEAPTPPAEMMTGPADIARQLPLRLPLQSRADGLHSNPGEPQLTQSTVLNELAEGIARATTQGALRLAPQVDNGMAGGGPFAVTAPAAANIRLRLPGEEAWLPRKPPEESSCPQDRILDVATWGPGESDPHNAIGAIRAMLSEDVDAVDDERALDLARLYISLGFGAEARAVLEAMVPRRPETPLLSAMSKIVDGEAAPSGILEAFSECPGRVQLWFTLAGRKPGDAKAVLAAVSELPLALRRHVGPTLIDVFLNAGDEATAEAIRAAVERAAGPHGGDFELAAAQIDLGRDTGDGLETIRDIAAATSPSSDEALAVLLEVTHDRGDTVDAASLTLAGTRADDLRGTPEGLRLQTGLIRALVQSDAFDAAALRLSSGGLPPETVATLATEFFAALAKRGSDDAVLVHGAGLSATLAELVQGTPAGPAIASRLLDLGLPEVARSYLRESATDPATVFVTARMKLLSGNPQDALAFLDRLPEATPEHLRLRADALWSVGRTEEATLIRRDLDGAEAGSDGTAGGPISTTQVKPSGSSPRDLVIASEAARQQIDALLAADPSP